MGDEDEQVRGERAVGRGAEAIGRVRHIWGFGPSLSGGVSEVSHGIKNASSYIIHMIVWYL